MLSRAHPLARRVRALRNDAAQRASEGVIVAEGLHLALEALRSHVTIEAAIVSPRLADTREGRTLELDLRKAGVPLHEASASTLDALQDARSPQPVLLVVKRSLVPLVKVVEGRSAPPLLLVACGVQDPGNLGAILRTADAAAATGFVSTEGSASLTHPRSVRASMGSIFRLPAVEATVDEVLGAVKSSHFALLGATARGETAYHAVDWRGAVALFLGGEASGLPPEVEAALDRRVAVPMGPGVESLSVNAAAAVLLFEAARTRGAVNRAG